MVKKPEHIISLETAFVDLDISVRMMLCLSSAGLKAIGDVAHFTVVDWARVKVATRQLLELLLVLEPYGIVLKNAGDGDTCNQGA